MRFSILAPVALTVAAMSYSASAAEVFEIDFTPANRQGTGQPVVFVDDGKRVTVSGWSKSGDTIREATVGVWSSGLGVIWGKGDDSHTIDNSGRTDFIILEFDQTVALSFVNFNTGWGFGDTDATIGVFTLDQLGDVSALLTDVFASDARRFWTKASGDSLRNINPDQKSGNVWLIGASFDNPDRFKDGFKLLSIEGTAVPEPGTWMMMVLGFGLLGAALRLRRRREAQPLFAF